MNYFKFFRSSYIDKYRHVIDTLDIRINRLPERRKRNAISELDQNISREIVMLRASEVKSASNWISDPFIERVLEIIDQEMDRTLGQVCHKDFNFFFGKEIQDLKAKYPKSKYAQLQGQELASLCGKILGLSYAKRNLYNDSKRITIINERGAAQLPKGSFSLSQAQTILGVGRVEVLKRVHTGQLKGKKQKNGRWAISIS